MGDKGDCRSVPDEFLYLGDQCDCRSVVMSGLASATFGKLTCLLLIDVGSVDGDFV